MKHIARFSLIGLVLAGPSATAFAQELNQPGRETLAISDSDIVAARNTARDFIVANYKNQLQKSGVNLDTCTYTVREAAGDQISVLITDKKLFALIMLSAEEFDVVDHTVIFY